MESDADNEAAKTDERFGKLPEAWIGRFAANGTPIWEEPMLYAGQGSLRTLVLHRRGTHRAAARGYDV